MSPLRCRSCRESRLREVLSLGRMPLANAFLGPAQDARNEKKYPLDLVFCEDCFLLQITQTIPPEELFRDYLYVSSYSETAMAHARRLTQTLTERLGLGAHSRVVEIASNDGYLLAHYREMGIPVLGIEPAVNLARISETQRGVPVRAEFFTEALAGSLAADSLQADLIHAHNVLAHVEDLNGFVRGLKRLLKKEGTAVLEVPWVRDMIEKNEFDTVYHEHLCYFSFTALDLLFRRHGLVIEEVEKLSIHGGSLRLWTAHAGKKQGASAQELLAEEAEWGVARHETYSQFAEKVREFKAALRKLLTGLKSQGCRLAAYGASAKGTMLLNYCEIGPGLLDFVVDRNPYKQGRRVPGVHVPVAAPERLLSEMPDYALLLAWNFKDEILGQQQAFLARGGKWIVPIPEIEILDLETAGKGL